MYCSHCGVQVAAHAAFCASCGGAQPGNVSNRRLVRPTVGRKLGGVCLAIANYLNVEITLVRVIAVLAMLIPPFPAVLVYIICWVVIPSEENVVQPAPYAHPVHPPQAQSNQ